VIVNMIVDLAGASFETPDEATVLAAAGVDLLNREGASDDDIAWIKRTFHGRWHEEAAAGWNWFARGPLGVAGFAAYGQHSINFWWLEQWWDRKDVGIFGPMGVDKKLRGMRLGVVLARRALASLQAMGYAQAIIPAVGPVKFYEKHCGARVVERLKRRL
jgi:GNAT superfamily N-acetyltransferase